MEYGNFKLEIDKQGIALFAADRPEKMNAPNDESWAEINDLFFWTDQSDGAKVVIIMGVGSEAFITGADLNSLKVKKPMDCLGGAGQKVLNRTQKCPKPVIAVVNRYASGRGCETAIACDFRVISENALFTLPETGLGILPGAGGTQRLSRLIGLGRVMDVILMGRETGAEEAVKVGLTTKYVPQWELLLEAKKIAGELVAKGPVALRITEQVVIASLSNSQETGELLGMLALSILCGTEDKMESVPSLLEKQMPDYGKE